MGWTYQGNGVWTGADLDGFLRCDSAREQRFREVLDAARAHVLSFGSLFPTGYLQTHARLDAGSRWNDEVETTFVVEALERMRGLLVG